MLQLAGLVSQSGFTRRHRDFVTRGASEFENKRSRFREISLHSLHSTTFFMCLSSFLGHQCNISEACLSTLLSHSHLSFNFPHISSCKFSWTQYTGPTPMIPDFSSKIHGVLLLLWSMRLSALDLVTKILGDPPEYKSWKLGMFKSCHTLHIGTMEPK